jgi:tRNA (Thr-GGU) A37 N-methylase
MTGEHAVCSICRRTAPADHIFTIDEKPVCAHCLFGDVEPVSIYPIGTVRRDGDPGSHDTGEACRIELHAGQLPFLYKLDEESHITVVYYLHLSDHVETVFDRMLDGKRVGVYASRTPDRPSRIAVQDVELLSIAGTTLHVRGLDAVDGSPVLDIKMSMRGTEG